MGGKIKVSSSASVRKKGQKKYPSAPTRMPADVGSNFKIRIRKK